jgi:propanol-preferring alcohol dehydrogenase
LRLGSRGADKEELAKELGAHVYINSTSEDAVAALQCVDGDQAIAATDASGEAMGRLVPDSVECVSACLRRSSVHGGLTGAPIDSEDTLNFSVLEEY